MKSKLKMKTAAVAMAVYFMVISLVTINAVSPLSCGAEETARRIATISITTPDGSEPKCDYISSPEGCWGASITNNEYIDFDDLETKPQGVFTDVLFDGRTYQLKLKMRVEMTIDEEYVE